MRPDVIPWRRLWRRLPCGWFGMGVVISGVWADDRPFEESIRPVLSEYCLKCHSAEKHKGDFDLEQYASLDGIKRHPKIWQKVLDQVADQEMPPKDKPQPSGDEKTRLMTWIRGALDAVALERAGDPGPVVLRRLSNAEYTYTVRDLTGVESLDPAREFPVDGAAGEGFTNTGQALVISPSLITKYLEAGKAIAAHAVLLPEGLRFSSKTTRRDWTEEILADIRGFYRQFTDPRGADQVNLQGIVFDTNEGGRLPLDRYLAASLELRDAGARVESVARTHELSAKYLSLLTGLLRGGEPSPLLDGLRTRWRAARPEDVAALAGEIVPWQKALWKFSSVGHIGKAGGPKAWLEPVTPLVSAQELRLKLAPPASGSEIVIYLEAADAGDGATGDFVVWQQPKLVIPGRPPLLLRDLRDHARALTERRGRVFASTAQALSAAVEASATPGAVDIDALARIHGVEADALTAWFNYLGIGAGGAIKLDHFTTPLARTGAYDFVKGWGSPDTPSLMANSSDQHVRIPGNLKPHGVVVHPSPTLQAAVGWRSPIAATLRIEGTVTHAHPECGNGVTWSLELRRAGTRQRLAAGVAQGGAGVPVGPVDPISVQPGDLVSLLVGPRNGDHSCDLTDLEFKLTSAGEAPHVWSLTSDVSADVLAGNPHADASGHEGVWHFYTEPVAGGGNGPVIPAGSLLARWQAAEQAAEKHQLAVALQALLTAAPPAVSESPDAALYRQLTSLVGPLFAGTSSDASVPKSAPDPSSPSWGLDPAQFGHHPNGSPIDSDSLCVQAPSVIEIRLPADLVAGSELVTTATLDSATGAEGSVQVQVLASKPAPQSGLRPDAVTITDAQGAWTSNNQRIAHARPIIVRDGGATRARFEAAFDEFRGTFPAALCYTKIVPVDEVVTLTLFYREDDHLCRLMLDEAQKSHLDQLWSQLHFVSHDALTLVDAFEQLWQFATQDADPKVFEPMREPIKQRAAAFRQQLIDSQPRHLDAVLEFAGRAYRRPLTADQVNELRGLYGRLREQELPHDEAIRLTLARMLVAPAFLYRAERAVPGLAQAPVNDWELASRLSYFLWSSPPDAELYAAAKAGVLHDPEGLATQAKRMLRDPRMRRMATEFGCSWLHVHGFDELNEKSERHFPTFPALRGAMYEETIRFFTDFFQNNRPVLSLLDADYTFLNEALATHYGIPGVTGETWRRVEGVRQFSRGGILGQATTLARQSGASRTSPILRGNWVAEALLGDPLPRPPKDVPRLPEDEATETLTVRQLTEKHSADPRCSGCHLRIDAFGYALESFDAIGRWRDQDLGNRPIDSTATVMDGTELRGLDGLRTYLLTKRRDAFLLQFCRKLLGYSLGRAVQLSDQPLLKEMQAGLAASGYHVDTAIDLIVRSRQFREIRGRDAAIED